MRQASWQEIFRTSGAEARSSTSFWARLGRIAWEDVLTFAIVLVGFLTVVRSIDNANWVSEMPSLYGIGLLGLGVGIVLSQLRRVPQVAAHLIGLVAGIACVGVIVGMQLEGKVWDRAWNLGDRLYVWGDALLTGGISNDNIPFVVLVVSATFLAAYIASWSIFRWYNAWLALIPGGLALLTNISYLPGDHSVTLLIYLFCSIVLISRVHLLRQQRQWRETNTKYPQFISLSVLNFTVWVGVGLLALAWVTPVASGSGTLYSLWIKVTDPVVEPLNDLGRVFSAIDGKKPGPIHEFGSTLPFKGSISPGNSEVLEVTTAEPGFLRAQSYDVYTAQGWLVGSENQITSGAWPALEPLDSVEELTEQDLRRAVSLQVTTSKKSNVILSVGQPFSINIDTRVVFGPGPKDVASIRPADGLDENQQYQVESTISNASAEDLRQASQEYSEGLQVYTELPDEVPSRIRGLALGVVAEANNPFDKAEAVEDFLRTFPVDLQIEPAPHNRDSIDYFLFDQQRGYFDYHASAMVVMLRTLGIPARLAIGYHVDTEDRVPSTSSYTVRESNAFAWPEVYFPGHGWIEFNPTPSAPTVFRPEVNLDALVGPVPLFEEEEYFPVEGSGVLAPAAPEIDTFTVEEGSNLVSRILMTIVMGMVGITALGFVVFHYTWQHGLRAYSYPVQIWEKTLRLGRWTRIRPMPQDTPREVVARLRREFPAIDDIDYIGESYMRSRYGGKDLNDDERQRLTQVWTKARNNLLQRLFRWR